MNNNQIMDMFEHISTIIEITACRETPPEILLNATRSVIRRCQQCLEQNDAQFEQFRRNIFIVIFIVCINE
jgi:DNA-directed RNA polymerase subunit L